MDYIDIFIKNDYIDLKQIAESGQCFRWKKICPGRYLLFLMDGRHVFSGKDRNPYFVS